MNHVPTEAEIAALIVQLTPEQLQKALKYINDLQDPEDVN